LKLQTIALDADLEPAEEVAPDGLLGARDCAVSRLSPAGWGANARQRETAGCGTGREQAPTSVARRVSADRRAGGHALEREARSLGIRNGVMPGGRRVPLLKTMITSVCERDCYYCPFRSGRDCRRATFQPDEIATLFNQMTQARLVEGLFLSSGVVAGGVTTQDRLIAVADILRNRYAYRGYLHLKLMPGAQKDQVLRALQLADRVSINLEAPNQVRLANISPKKRYFEELLRPLQWTEEIRRTQSARRAFRGRWPSAVTQFVVGAAGETDRELLQATRSLLRELRLARVYFSGFTPIPETPLEDAPAADPMREHRLYQAFFLFRDYGFDLKEMPFDQQGNLPLEDDPKLAWARGHLLHAPVELNRADRRQLLRVPGIGPESAKAILRARREGTLRSLADLRVLGVSVERAAEFILLDGRRPARQLRLF